MSHIDENRVLNFRIIFRKKSYNVHTVVPVGWGYGDVKHFTLFVEACFHNMRCPINEISYLPEGPKDGSQT
jgi:hypothetical protein